jgi:hypothetical protein
LIDSLRAVTTALRLQVRNILYHLVDVLREREDLRYIRIAFVSICHKSHSDHRGGLTSAQLRHHFFCFLLHHIDLPLHRTGGIDTEGYVQVWTLLRRWFVFGLGSSLYRDATGID